MKAANDQLLTVVLIQIKTDVSEKPMPKAGILNARYTDYPAGVRSDVDQSADGWRLAGVSAL